MGLLKLNAEHHRHAVEPRVGLYPAGVESSCACHTVPSAKSKEDIGEENQATRRIA